MEFKVGDIVECIDVGLTKSGFKPHLTIGKYYGVLTISSPSLYIYDDDGQISQYLISRFKLVTSTETSPTIDYMKLLEDFWKMPWLRLKNRLYYWNKNDAAKIKVFEF